jgi:hypothetical protein
MKVEVVVGVSGCVGGDCPTIYRTDRGTFVVQGNRLNPAEVSQLHVPEHEILAEIPETLVRSLASKLAGGL